MAVLLVFVAVASNTAVASYGGALAYSLYEHNAVEKQKGSEDLAKTVVSALTSGIGSSINITPGKTGSLDITSDGSVVLRSTVNGGITLNGNLVLNSAVTGAIADVNAALSDNGTSVSMSKGNDTSPSTQAETLDEFYERVKKLSPSERVAEYKQMADKVMKEKDIKQHKKISKLNNRIVYYDESSDTYYSLDTLHGTFEKCNIKGKHLGEFRLDFVQLDGPYLSGNHDIRIK